CYYCLSFRFSRALRGPPTLSTPFPYTTLFRSLLGQLLADRAGKPYRQLLEERVLRPHGMSGIYFDVASAPRDRLVQGWRANGLKDRKSTRLNSSHVKISYAVFCLKKKKKERA